MSVRLTAAQYAALGSPAGVAGTVTPPARRRATRPAVPRAGAVTVCHTCGHRCAGETAEARHTATARHYRYDCELT
jgi:hypothetical protein